MKNNSCYDLLRQIDYLAKELDVTRQEVIDMAIFLDSFCDSLSQRGISICIETSENISPELKWLIDSIQNYYL